MTHDQIQKRIEEAAKRFAETQDERYKDEVVRLTVRLAELRNIDVLASAVARCRNEDIRTTEVNHALGFLESRTTDKEPFKQFHKALANGNGDALDAALEAIRRALGVD